MRGEAYHQRLLPAHTQLKTRYGALRDPFRSTIVTHDRQPGQGGDADPQPRDLRAQLLEAEAAHFSKTKGIAASSNPTSALSTTSTKRQLEAGQSGEAEDVEAKRRRVLEETRDIDADSDGSDNDSSDEDRCVCQSKELQVR